ncbi:glycerophosphodiester phosphodiesterase [Winogradskyella sp. PC-19]|uniref:glycerophosphodiester phosphodiesterase family protein n=1 Tax=unclassified Winogradskyella TaxID=2615021 RepID=UPI000B3C239B|nr:MULTISPECIES: glycerophosphodiester phosphodiesterase family protein [unclassified Winogradskyella]ARV08176.1 glycerophosphodiester phosphodiesterase [Winogradskyella sp. PC-19]
MRYIYVLVFSLFFFGCKTEKSNEQSSDSVLLETFRYSNNKAPQISVHRGGKSIKNYPENCLETIQYVNKSMSAIYEIDIAKTKDGKLVLMHDNSIDRTTTGTGLVKNLTYKQLKNFNLVDDYGNETNFKMPLFDEVLDWSKKNNVVLSVDIKRSVPQSEVIKAIKYANAEDVCIIITYDLAQAQFAYKSAPDMMLSVSGRNDREVDALLKSGIPTKNMIAFTGTRLSDKSLFKKLHDNDILCMLGTLGNLDKRAETRGDVLYSEWLDLGVDMLATDRPFAVAEQIKK